MILGFPSRKKKNKLIVSLCDSIDRPIVLMGCSPDECIVVSVLKHIHLSSECRQKRVDKDNVWKIGHGTTKGSPIIEGDVR